MVLGGEPFSQNEGDTKTIPKNSSPKIGPKNTIFPQFGHLNLSQTKRFPKIRVRAPCFDRAKEVLGNTQKFPKRSSFWGTFWDWSDAVQFELNCSFLCDLLKVTIQMKRIK
jgi:hypothetical protein